MTLPEVLLWRELRGKPLGIKFRRQFPVLGFVADFACVEVRLLIEVDGIAHDMGERPERDMKRDAMLTDRGWQVIRIAAKDVLGDAARVAASIIALAASLRPLHHPADGPPPRSGEDHGRVRHRTLGASPDNVGCARKLRKEMSLPEVLLWQALRGKRPKFRRQYPLAGYVVDFACTSARYVEEIDGLGHDMGNNPARDRQRDQLIQSKGWHIDRIAARDVLADRVAIAESMLKRAREPLRERLE